jgi:hypothetical protein
MSTERLDPGSNSVARREDLDFDRHDLAGFHGLAPSMRVELNCGRSRLGRPWQTLTISCVPFRTLTATSRSSVAPP